MKAALHIFIVVSSQTIKHRKEFNFWIKHRHPSKVKSEEKQKGQEHLTSNNDALVFNKPHKRFQETFLIKKDFIYLRIRVLVKSLVKHSYKGLLNSRLSFS